MHQKIEPWVFVILKSTKIVVGFVRELFLISLSITFHQFPLGFFMLLFGTSQFNLMKMRRWYFDLLIKIFCQILLHPEEESPIVNIDGRVVELMSILGLEKARHCLCLFEISTTVKILRNSYTTVF